MALRARAFETDARMTCVLISGVTLLSRFQGEWNHVSTRCNSVQIVRPALHHPASLLDMAGAVVRVAERVAYLVRELRLDDVNRLFQNFI